VGVPADSAPGALERLQRLAELASLRQHQKELADLWADRLLNAAHRTPEQFEEMVAELDRRAAS
jgi:hypothetical protein